MCTKGFVKEMEFHPDTLRPVKSALLEAYGAGCSVRIHYGRDGRDNYEGLTGVICSKGGLPMIRNSQRHFEEVADQNIVKIVAEHKVYYRHHRYRIYKLYIDRRHENDYPIGVFRYHKDGPVLIKKFSTSDRAHRFRSLFT